MQDIHAVEAQLYLAKVSWLTWPGKEFDRYHTLVSSGWFDLQNGWELGQLSAPGYPEQADDYNSGCGVSWPWLFLFRRDQKYVRLCWSTQTKLTNKSRQCSVVEKRATWDEKRSGRAFATEFWSISSPTDPGCVPHAVQPTLKHQWTFMHNKASMQTYLYHPKKKFIISPIQTKYYASVARTPMANKPRRWIYQMSCLGLKKSAMSMKAKDETNLQFLRGQIQGSLLVKGRRPM